MKKSQNKSKVVSKKKVKAKKKLTVKKNPVAKKKVKLEKRGRPPYEITDKVCEKARSIAAQGLTIKQIAYVLGMGETTLLEKQKLFPTFKWSIKKGRAEGIKKVSNALFKKAIGGGDTAMIFYLKNRDPENWKDVQKRQYLGLDDEPIEPSSITIEVVRPDEKE